MPETFTWIVVIVSTVATVGTLVVRTITSSIANTVHRKSKRVYDLSDRGSLVYDPTSGEHRWEAPTPPAPTPPAPEPKRRISIEPVWGRKQK